RDLDQWEYEAGCLGQTRDPDGVALLRPALEDTRARRSTRRMHLAGGLRLPQLRVCDTALDAILTILDGSPDPAYKKAEFDAKVWRRDRGDLDEAANDARNGMIADLKKRLASDKRQK